MSSEMEVEGLRKYDKARLKEILKQTNEEMDRVNEECNVLLEILLRKRYKNISETKPFMLRVGKKRYRENDGSAEHDEELTPPVPIGRKPDRTMPGASASSVAATSNAVATEETKDTEDVTEGQGEADPDVTGDIDESKAVDGEDEPTQEEPEEANEEGGEGDDETEAAE